MSEFSVKVRRIDSVENHPNADRLSICKIGEFTTISAKKDDGTHRYRPNDLVVYVPSDSVVPEYLLIRGGFWNKENNIGTLSGSAGNRVKPIRLRGIFSEGLLFPTHYSLNWGVGEKTSFTVFNDKEMIICEEGDDVANFLGITKWEPTIPLTMAGQVGNSQGHTMKYDIENFKNYPNVLIPGEEVVATEKLHGTNTQIIFVENIDGIPSDILCDHFMVTSKGNGAKGIVLKINEENASNLYVKALKENLESLKKVVEFLKTMHVAPIKKITLFGEIFGQGIQDLSYGLEKPTMRLFDIAIDNAFIDFPLFVKAAQYAEMQTVPVVALFKFDVNQMKEMTSGNTTFKVKQIREGIVVKPVKERYDEHLGRVILKSVSEDYLTRKGDVTEYQ